MKNKIKNKILNIVCLLGVSLSLIFGVIFGIGQVNFKTNSGESASAVATYGDADTLLSGYLSNSVSLDTSYNITDTYPLLIENQTTSNYCWIYSSMKALESTLILKTGEYYNFSESATAVLGYLNGITYNGTINSDGNFTYFLNISQNYGLVYESEFSNDKFDDIDESNIKNYSYVSDLASFEVINTVEAIDFANCTSYYTATQENKQNVIKQFILENGGLTVGIEGGTIYPTNDGYYRYTTDIAYQGSRGVQFSSSHMVCIVGWDDDKEGFIAINSWGIESGYCSTFVIPYDYSYMYYTLYGFVYVGSPEVLLESSSAKDFSAEILNISSNVKNIFTYEETISLIYCYYGDNFEKTYVEIMKGTEDVTSSFTVSFDYDNEKIQIKQGTSSIDFVGGTYLVKVYSYDFVNGDLQSEIVAVENFFVYTGTEVSYFKLLKYDSSSASSSVYGYAGLSSSVSSESTFSFYVSYNDSFNLNFYLTEINDCVSTGSKLSYSYSITEYYMDENDNVVSKSTNSLTILTDNKESLLINRYIISFGSLTSFSGERLQIALTFNSMSYGNAVQRIYYINLFVSEDVSIKNSYAYSIEYDLDGGKNSDNNVDIYPDYNSRETNMTAINLESPTKQGYEFWGWYLDSDFTEAITKIDGNCSGDLKLYARWIAEETIYFDTEFSMSELTDYNNISREVADNIIYGDDITYKFKFTEREALNNVEYKITIEWYINNETTLRQETSKFYTGNNQTIEDTYKFSSMELGVGIFKIYIIVSIRYYNVIYNISEIFTQSCTNEIYQKQVTAEIVSGSFQTFSYDGTYHDLSNLITVLGVYDEDETSFEISTNISSVKNVGNYKLYIDEISNDNYYYEIDDENDIIDVEVVPKEISVYWEDCDFVYNGRSNIKSYEFGDGDIVSGDYVSLNYSIADENGNIVESCINVGEYTITAINVNNDNYTFGDNIYQTNLIISQAQVEILFVDIVERLQTASIYRSDVSYSIVSGVVYSSDDLGIEIYCDGKKATTSGVYPIMLTWTNKNYNLTFNEATYTVDGTYYVYYTLPDGTIYTETVEDLQDPSGKIPSSVYKKAKFSYLKFSESLTYTGSDMYITVTEVSYLWIVILAPCILSFFVIYLFITRKSRRNRIS